MRRIALALAVVLGASPALAEAVKERPQGAITLKYLRSPAAAACPGPDFLREQIARRLRYDLVSAGAPEHLALRIERRNGRYRVTGEIRDQDGRVAYAPETIDDPDCVEAVKNTAILLAVHFTGAGHAPPALPPPPSTLISPSLPPPTPPAKAPVRLQFGLATTLALGLSPSVVAGPSWLVAARVSRVSFELEGRALFAPSVHASGASIVPIIVTGSAAACVHAGPLFGCARFELGALHFASTTELTFEPPTPVLAGLGARVGAEWPIADHLALRGYADLLTFATPIQLRLTMDRSLLWSSPLLSPSFGLGIEASF